MISCSSDDSSDQYFYFATFYGELCGLKLKSNNQGRDNNKIDFIGLTLEKVNMNLAVS